jgi:hypothetical protein
MIKRADLEGNGYSTMCGWIGTMAAAPQPLSAISMSRFTCSFGSIGSLNQCGGSRMRRRDFARRTRGRGGGRGPLQDADRLRGTARDGADRGASSLGAAVRWPKGAGGATPGSSV